MNLFSALITRRRRGRTMDMLRRLDDRLLRDIGFERDQIGLLGRQDFARLQDMGR